MGRRDVSPVTRAAWLALGAALGVWGLMLRSRFASPPVSLAAIEQARAVRRARQIKEGREPDGLPGSPFGSRPDPHGAGTIVHHAGADIECPTGTPLLAVDRGVVVGVELGTSAGNIIRLGTRHGRVSFMHLSRVDVVVGQQVAAGDVIGATGATGRITGPHLHIEVKPEGAAGAVDPAPFFL